MSFRKKVLLLILLSTFLRCGIALILEFGNDEVYYWTYGLHLEWNYFDHPPMVALLTRLTSFNLHFRSEFFIRLGPIICAAINTWLVYLIGRKIKDERAGWYAGLLYCSSFYCSIIAGTFILPDSPQLLFWVLSLFLMTEITGENLQDKRKGLLLLLLGVTIGLCIMSKVHGIFLWVGFGPYILFFQRKLLSNPYLYGAVLLTVMIISPIFIWNWKNDFITWSFHNDRVGFFGKRLDIDSFLQQVFGSAFYNNPVNFVLYVIALISVGRKKMPVSSNWLRLYLLLGLPLIGVLLVMSVFNETLPHWSGPAYISILLLTAAYLSGKNEGAAKIPRPLLSAVILFFVIAAGGVIAISWLPVQIGKKDGKDLGKGDVTLDMNGWKQFSQKFDSLYRSDIKTGMMKPNSPVIADYWFPAAHLDYYVAAPLGINFIAIGKLRDIHHYAWLNKERPGLAPGNDAYFIYPSNYYGPPREELRKHFDHLDSLAILQTRMNLPVRNFVIYRMHGYLGGIRRDGVFTEK